MSKQRLLRLLLSITITMLPVCAFAVGVKISRVGDGKYVVQGSDMQETAGVQLWITYDAAKLTQPVITPGDLFAARYYAKNEKTNPASVVVIGTTPLGDPGANCTIATISFTVKAAGASNPVVKWTVVDSADKTKTDQTGGDSAGSDTGSNTSGSDSNNGSQNGGVPTGGIVGTGTTTVTAGTGNGAASGVPFIAGGTLTLPPTDMPANEKKESTHSSVLQDIADRTITAPRESSSPSSPGNDDNLSASKTAAQVAQTAPAQQPEPTPHPIQSVLERFGSFQGEKSVKSLTALFDRDGGASFKQSPAIAVADGKATVRLVISKVPAGKSPNFAFNSARYVSLAQVDENQWEVEVRPDAGAVKASVTMFANGTLQEFPLTVVPKAEVALRNPAQLDDADFLLFLKERGTAAAPKHDLNGDGKRDYLDDYIYTGNFLVRMEEMKKNKRTAQQKAH